MIIHNAPVRSMYNRVLGKAKYLAEIGDAILDHKADTLLIELHPITDPEIDTLYRDEEAVFSFLDFLLDNCLFPIESEFSEEYQFNGFKVIVY